MKITIVIGSLERGGAERQIVEFVRAAHPHHALVNVICLGPVGSLAPEIRSVGAKVTSIGLTGLTARSLLAPWRLGTALRRERPDVVYGFLFWGYTMALPVAAVAARWALRVEARRSQPEEDTARPIFRPLRLLADRLAHGVVANSAAVADATERANPALTGRVHVVTNGVSIPTEVTRAATGTSTPTIICVANFIAYKGHETLLDALHVLADRGVAFRCLLVGDGPERVSIERLVDGLGLNGRVDILGQRDDVPELLASAHLAVLPSYTEGLPNAVLEAMAHGLPIVASDVGGVRELLGNDAGVVVTPRNAGALADGLSDLLRDGAMRSRMGSAGRSRVQSEYGIAQMRDRTLSVFRDLAADRSEAIGRRRPT